MYLSVRRLGSPVRCCSRFLHSPGGSCSPIDASLVSVGLTKIACVKTSLCLFAEVGDRGGQEGGPPDHHILEEESKSTRGERQSDYCYAYVNALEI